MAVISCGIELAVNHTFPVALVFIGGPEMGILLENDLLGELMKLVLICVQILYG